MVPLATISDIVLTMATCSKLLVVGLGRNRRKDTVVVLVLVVVGSVDDECRVGRVLVTE
jgi:hypothetical protein